MPFTVACPACRQPYTVTDDLRGRPLRCTRCQQIFPATPPGPAPMSRIQPPPQAFMVPTHARPQPPQAILVGNSPPMAAHAPAPALPIKLIAAAGGAVLLVMIVVIGAVAWQLAPRKPGPVAVLATRPERASTEPNKSVATMRMPATEPHDPRPTRPVTPPTRPDTPPPPPTGELPADVLKRVKRATVHLRVTLPGGGRAQGSGFFGMEPGLILTNAHVVGMLEADSRAPRDVEATLNSGLDDEKKFQVTVLAVDRNSDLAVLRVGGNPQGLPPPLEVKSAKDLLETQKVVVFGFPFGDQLGREISVRDSSVASLRRENGILAKVQVNGGMNPGNSGGPVVDLRGDVIGVAVSGIDGTSINFAVPGDLVHSVFSGRISDLGLGQPYTQNNRLSVTASMVRIDPLNRMKELALDVWTGDPGPTRPPANAQPATQPGDSPHIKTVLDGKATPAVGDVTLPPLPAGKVYWVQPRWMNGAGEPRWASASVWEMPAPVERKPITLAVKHVAGDRPLSLSFKQAMRVRLTSSEGTLDIGTDTKMTESTQAANDQGAASVRLQYKTLDLEMIADGKPLQLGDADKRIVQDFGKMISALRVNAQGRMTGHVPDLGQVPAGSRRELGPIAERMVMGLDALSVNAPTKMLTPLETWKDTRQLPIDTIGRVEVASMEVTYTYLGTRTRNGRQEAVIALSAPLVGRRGQEKNVGGRMDGTMIFDMTAGQVSQVDVKATIEVEATLRSGRPAKLTGTLKAKLDRDVVGK